MAFDYDMEISLVDFYRQKWCYNNKSEKGFYDKRILTFDCEIINRSAGVCNIFGSKCSKRIKHEIGNIEVSDSDEEYDYCYNNEAEKQEFWDEFENIEIKDKKRTYLVVIVYDIVDDKRRAKMSKLLKSFGVRVQKSVFECILSNSQYKRLLKIITRYFNENEDLLRVYKLYQTIEIKTWGRIGRIEDDDIIII